MNAQIQAIRNALTIDGDTQLHNELVQKSQKLRQTLDKITNAVSDREAKYAEVAKLRDEMTEAMDKMAIGEEPDRPVTKIASAMKRVNDSIDREIDKVYDLITEADTLRSEVSELTRKIGEIPLVATAA